MGDAMRAGWEPPRLVDVLRRQLHEHGFDVPDARRCARELDATRGAAARASLFVDLGACHLLQGDPTAAVSAWRHASVAGQPAPAARAVYNLAVFHHELGLYDLARQQFDAVIDHRVEPYASLAHIARASSQLALDDHDGALAGLARLAEDLLGRRPDSPLIAQALLGVGAIAESTGQFPRADQAYRAVRSRGDAATADPATMGLLRVLRHQGRHDEAQQLIGDAAIALVDPAIALDRIELLIRLGRLEEAATAAETLDASDFSVDERFQFASILIDVGAVNPAIDELERLSLHETAETRARASYLLGEVYFGHRMYDPARAMLEQVEDLAPGYWSDKAALALGDLAFEQGAPREAASLWAQAAASDVLTVAEAARRRLVEAVDASATVEAPPPGESMTIDAQPDVPLVDRPTELMPIVTLEDLDEDSLDAVDPPDPDVVVPAEPLSGQTDAVDPVGDVSAEAISGEIELVATDVVGGVSAEAISGEVDEVELDVISDVSAEAISSDVDAAVEAVTSESGGATVVAGIAGIAGQVVAGSDEPASDHGGGPVADEPAPGGPGEAPSSAAAAGSASRAEDDPWADDAIAPSLARSGATADDDPWNDESELSDATDDTADSADAPLTDGQPAGADPALGSPDLPTDDDHTLTDLAAGTTDAAVSRADGQPAAAEPASGPPDLPAGDEDRLTTVAGSDGAGTRPSEADTDAPEADPAPPAAPQVISLRRRAAASADTAPPTPAVSEIEHRDPRPPLGLASDGPSHPARSVESEAELPKVVDAATSDRSALPVPEAVHEAAFDASAPVIDDNPYAALAPDALDADLPAARNPYAELAPGFGGSPVVDGGLFDEGSAAQVDDDPIDVPDDEHAGDPAVDRPTGAFSRFA